jgi:hypothetical protein
MAKLFKRLISTSGAFLTAWKPLDLTFGNWQEDILVFLLLNNGPDH